MNSLILHASIVLYYVTVWLGLLPLVIKVEEIEDERLDTMRSIGFRFLTIWNLMFQSIAFFGYFVYDVWEARQRHTESFRRKFKGAIDDFFYSVIVTETTVVVILFWILYSIDPKLVFIYPTIVGDVLTPWANHTMHTNILPLAVLQVYHNKASPIKYSAGKKNVAIVTVLYLLCLYGTYFQKNIWIYPYLGYLHEPLRTISILITIMATFGIHYGFYHLNEWYCSTGAEEKIRKLN